MFPDNGRRCKEDRGMARSCCDPAQARDEERDPGKGSSGPVKNPPGPHILLETLEDIFFAVPYPMDINFFGGQFEGRRVPDSPRARSQKSIIFRWPIIDF